MFVTVVTIMVNYDTADYVSSSHNYSWQIHLKTNLLSSANEITHNGCGQPPVKSCNF